MLRTLHNRRLPNIAVVLAIALVLASCSAVQELPQTTIPEASVITGTGPVKEEVSSETTSEASEPEEIQKAGLEPLTSEIYRGTGEFLAPGVQETSEVKEGEGGITLNFQGADVQEIIKAILGDILGYNYVVDQEVRGTVNLQTTSPMQRESLFPILESLLQANGLALVRQGSLYRVTLLAKATKNAETPQVARRVGPGYHIQVVPLSYVAATEMQKILEPFMAKEALLLADDKRNLLMLAGTSQELENWLGTIELFDVDWLKGQSMGLFPLEFAEAKTVAEELLHIIGTAADKKLAGILRILPLERLNALLVVTPQADYLEKVENWIERLDRVGIKPGINLYVYRVKNRKAVDLATVVSSVFENQGGSQASKSVSLSPGLEATKLESKPKGSDKDKKAEDKTKPETPKKTESVITLSEDSQVRVVADEQNNSLLIMATAEEYRIIESALRRLDTIPLQVLIEASIVDVILTDELRYGIEWYFKNNNVINDHTGIGQLDLGGVGLGIATGFSYSIVDSSGMVRAVLNTLAQESKINVVSSPSLMVLDNSSAEIRVGNQQPVRTTTSETEGGTILENIEYKDTGVSLSVTPRVNPGGLVTLEVIQEVIDVGDIDEATGQRSFLQRNIESTVAVKNGQTIVLGGLITENDTRSESGIPVLYKLPVVGKLFGSTNNSNVRNELLVLLTPRVVEAPKDADAIMKEYQQKMRNLRQEWQDSETISEAR